MKILEQYIYAIGKHLPYDSRQEIKKELHASLLDEIEIKFGDNPSQEDLEAAITSYGSPREVANRYKGDNLVIGKGYTDLFFFISKIIVFALSIAFTTLFVIGLFQGNLDLNKIMIELVKAFGKVINSSLSALGWLTAIFILLTRINQDNYVDLEDEWTPKELKDIKIGPETESKIGSGFAIFFILIFITIINILPHLPTIGENLFDVTGLLGHNLNIDLFKIYLLPLSIIWFGEIIYHILNLFYGTQSKGIVLYEVILNTIYTVLLIQMFLNASLYLNYTTLVGFRAIFLLVAIISIFETIGKAIKFVKYYIMES